MHNNYPVGFGRMKNNNYLVVMTTPTEKLTICYVGDVPYKKIPIGDV
jgi:hypothetical protein